ncbi:MULTISPECIES: hypothetical protein [unclassified Undibacterium]|nr:MULTISPECIES: hypothetical protein [unclassified Undibacterium]MEB0231863.1 hypothetical protein [Undibacterium sp. 10I3]
MLIVSGVEQDQRHLPCVARLRRSILGADAVLQWRRKVLLFQEELYFI